MLATLISLVEKNDISRVVMGVHRKSDSGSDMTTQFKEMVGDRAELIVVPEEDPENEHVM